MVVEEKSKGIIKEFFGKGTELSKELRLFNLLINEKYNTESKMKSLLISILEDHSKLIIENLNEKNIT